MTKLTLNKSQRIKKKRIFDELFKAGKSKNKFPIRMVWVATDLIEKNNLQTAFVVPKRLFKSATVRNLLKRRVKEAFRINQIEIVEHINQSEKKFAILFMYSNNEIQDFKIIEKSVKYLLQHFIKANELDK